MKPLPLPLRVAAGLAVTAAERARELPKNLVGLPVTVASQVLQCSMRLQQQVTELAIKGDLVLSSLRPVEETPSWATFDEDLPPADETPDAHNGHRPSGGLREVNENARDPWEQEERALAEEHSEGEFDSGNDSDAGSDSTAEAAPTAESDGGSADRIGLRATGTDETGAGSASNAATGSLGAGAPVTGANPPGTRADTPGTGTGATEADGDATASESTATGIGGDAAANELTAPATGTDAAGGGAVTQGTGYHSHQGDTESAGTGTGATATSTDTTAPTTGTGTGTTTDTATGMGTSTDTAAATGAATTATATGATTDTTDTTDTADTTTTAATGAGIATTPTPPGEAIGAATPVGGAESEGLGASGPEAVGIEPGGIIGSAGVANYDELTLPQLRARLRRFTLEQLEELLEYERAHENRPSFVGMLARRIGNVQRLSTDDNGTDTD